MCTGYEKCASFTTETSTPTTTAATTVTATSGAVLEELEGAIDLVDVRASLEAPTNKDVVEALPRMMKTRAQRKAMADIGLTK